jgi:hypothetical protein
MCEAREGYAALKQVSSSTTRGITALQREQREKDRAIHAQFRHPKQVPTNWAYLLSLFTEPLLIYIYQNVCIAMLNYMLVLRAH